MYRSQPSNVTPFAAARHFPQRGQQGSLRIRLGAFQMVFCIPRLTPPARCAVLSFALSSCTPSGTATPAKPFRGGWTRLPGGGAGRLDGTSEPARLTCAPAGAMQASNRRQAALSESQRGCCSMDGNNSKSPTAPPLPLRGTSPKGGSKGAEHHPQRGQREKRPFQGRLELKLCFT